MKNTEIHLVVLWANARYAQDKIVADIKTHVDIMAAYDVHWSCDCVADNFTRFYGVNLPKNSGKEQECGTSGFLLLVVRDNNPKYEMTETSRGHEYVNINIFSLKQKYRQWTRGGHKVHTTNSVAETNHDSTLLLGLNYEDLKKSLPKKWDGKIKTIHRDITGAHGWTDLHELFYTLNATTDYVVLRNYEMLPQQFSPELHGDIDLLTDDYQNMQFILNAHPVFNEKHRVQNWTMVGGQKVLFDIRYCGDDYYCHKFEQDLLDCRKLNDKNIYVPDDKLSFYSLIYHALIHKQKIAVDYYDKIYALFVKLGLHKKYNIKKYTSPFDLYFQLLLDFMKTNGYDFTRPHDMSVFFSNNLCNFDKYKKYLESNFDFTDIHTVYTNSISRAYNVFVSGYDANKNRMFIKIGDIYGIYANEYRMGKILYDMDNVHFIRPMYWRDCADGHFVAYKWTDGDNLYDLLNSNKLSAKEKKVCIEDIYAIFKCLDKSHVVHRDITLNNLIWTNGHLKLIDFQLAVDSSKYKELEFLLRNPGLLRGLGTPEFRKKEFQWDDAYSLTKVLEHITAGKSYGEKYDKIYNEIKSCIGRNVIQCKPKQNGFRVYYKHLTVKLFGFPIYDRHVSTDKHVKIRLFGIRILKFKAK